MTSQTSQKAVNDSETLQQLEEKIEQEMREILKNSNLRTLLEENGISKDKIIKINFECNIELAQTISTDTAENKQTQGFLPSGLGPVVLRLKCCEDWQGNCVQC
ncbi:MAG: hypothetical protein RMY36_023015 [Nostoc sp. SerVER01]|nr:hypothetical protein [Nostoc sp. SerVER01]MDZ8073313.1 hypothetical protein [Nostoc sp. DedQUE01]